MTSYCPGLAALDHVLPHRLSALVPHFLFSQFFAASGVFAKAIRLTTKKLVDGFLVMVFSVPTNSLIVKTISGFQHGTKEIKHTHRC